jgi:hypothetical protein
LTTTQTKCRPIIFSDPMVRAILDGRKTQTRRVVKPQPPKSGEVFYWAPPGGRNREGWAKAGIYHRDNDGLRFVEACPYGQPGDQLWVREAWMPDPPLDGWADCEEPYSGADVEWNGCGRRIDGVPPQYRTPENCIYRATFGDELVGWKPSIHMPRWASRLTLEITDVRVERVQDISEGDAQAEGINWSEIEDSHLGRVRRQYFADLWDSINGKTYPWEANPWVWAIEFKRIDSQQARANG